MNRALITIASVGILAPTAWVMAANAQQMSPRAPAPPQAYARSQMAPTQTYTQRRVRRSARRAPAAAAAPAGTAYAAAPAGTARRAPARAVPRGAIADTAPGGAAYPYKWAASPGPKKRGNMCVKDVDALRGYGFMEPCKK